MWNISRLMFFDLSTQEIKINTDCYNKINVHNVEVGLMRSLEEL